MFFFHIKQLVLTLKQVNLVDEVKVEVWVEVSIEVEVSHN